MEEKRPVALWKGIVGTVISVTNVIAIPLIAMPFIFGADKIKTVQILWIIFGVCEAFAIIWLILNLYNLITAVKYRKKHKGEAKDNKVENKTELLHKLLEEGKITIEEYDRLSK